jgi:hypothetical protein
LADGKESTGHEEEQGNQTHHDKIRPAHFTHGIGFAIALRVVTFVSCGPTDAVSSIFSSRLKHLFLDAAATVSQ